MFACIHASAAASVAAQFAPEVEMAAPDTAVFDVAPLRRLYGGAREVARAIAEKAGPEARIAIAGNPDAAILAARYRSGVTVIEAAASSALAALPVECLPLTAEALTTLDCWGIRTCGDFAGLPEKGIAERFGEAGAHWRKLARGEFRRPLKIARPETVYEGRIELEYAAALTEPLLFVAARLLNEQCARLLADGMAACEARLLLDLEDGGVHERVLRMPVPMRESKLLLKLVRMDLEAHPPPAATRAVALRLIPAAPRRLQNGLFLPAAPEPGKLDLALGRIRALVGEENAGVPELLDTHRPAPFRLAPRRLPSGEPAAGQPGAPHLAFRYFRPALAARVELLRGRPARVEASGISGKITLASGPWRTSGGWWTGEPWDRDEWDVALAGGAFCRIHRRPDGAWFVEGVYD